MSRLNRSLILVCLIILALITGCGSNNELPEDNTPKEEFVYAPFGKAIYSPVDIPYAIDNPIEIKEIVEYSKKEDLNRYNYLVISGLNNKEVEEGINAAIKDMYDKLLLYANGELNMPYRGAKAAIAEQSITGSSIDISSYFNCNNVLSIVGNVSLNYNSVSDFKHFMLTETLNFDLNTGKQIFIGDVFTNDSDVIKLINDSINEAINKSRLMHSVEYDEYNSLSLVAPFKGINWDQKFYLSSNGINIVIDHNNPEFNINFYSVPIEVPYQSHKGKIAITKRFYDEEASIYNNKATDKRFLQSYNQRAIRDTYTIQLEGAYWYVSINYPDDLSQKLIDLVNKEVKNQEIMIKELKKDSTLQYAEQSVYCNRVGPFINLSGNAYFSIDNQGDWFQSAYVYTEDGRQLGLEDIFVEGFNYEALIKAAIARAAKDYQLSQEPDTEALFKDISFRIGEIGINFSTISYQWDTYNNHPLNFEVSYKEIGTDNLNIFD